MQDTNETWDLKQLGWKGFIRQLYAHHRPSGGALILRIALALVFITEGWSKVGNIGGTEHFFVMIGLTAHFWTYLVTYTELVGGILILLGIRFLVNSFASLCD